jgi:predicted RNA binding protein YcfA (HicA-like mRNA interferase family)
MTQIAKLYARLLADPGATLSFREFELLLHAFGFVHGRTKGSHRSYIHLACNRPLVVQPKGKDAKRYQVREFLGMIEQYDLTMDE